MTTQQQSVEERNEQFLNAAYARFLLKDLSEQCPDLRADLEPLLAKIGPPRIDEGDEAAIAALRFFEAHKDILGAIVAEIKPKAEPKAEDPAADEPETDDPDDEVDELQLLDELVAYGTLLSVIVDPVNTQTEWVMRRLPAILEATSAKILQAHEYYFDRT